TMHWYRFGMFVLLSIPILVFFLLKKDYSIVCAGALIVMIVAVATGPAILAEGAIAKQFNPLPNNIDGRVLIYTVPWEHDTEHEFQHEIPMLNKVEGARGLYQESSLLARFVYDLELEFNSDWSSAWWYSVDYGAARRLSRETVQEILAAQFNILNINYAISTKSFGLDWTPVKRIITEYKFNKGKTPERYDYVLYKVSDSNLIEVLDYYPEIIPKNEWFELAPVWFLSEEVKNGIFTDEEIPRMIGTGKEKVTILEKSPTMEYIKFRVDSNSAVPILIKISEFPNWRAYKDGKELKIYKAAPGFMLVHSNGTIELKYENTLADDLGNWLSLAGVILVILGIIFPRLINKFKSKQEKEF
ncbi:MAG: hypothetical protein NTY48_07110, partial [Candidatus Diapherotrites archaeon]|nr:hypothetical protein [Candidatus Diapherotrites archaeon]